MIDGAAHARLCLRGGDRAAAECSDGEGFPAAEHPLLCRHAEFPRLPRQSPGTTPYRERGPSTRPTCATMPPTGKRTSGQKSTMIRIRGDRRRARHADGACRCTSPGRSRRGRSGVLPQRAGSRTGQPHRALRQQQRLRLGAPRDRRRAAGMGPLAAATANADHIFRSVMTAIVGGSWRPLSSSSEYCAVLPRSCARCKHIVQIAEEVSLGNTAAGEIPARGSSELKDLA